MSMSEIVRVIGSLVVLSSLIPLVVFIYRYGRYSPWTENPIGIGYMVQKVAMAALMLFIIVTISIDVFFGHWVGEEWLRLLFYIGLVLTLWNDVRHIYRIQRQDKLGTTSKIPRILRKRKKTPTIR